MKFKEIITSSFVLVGYSAAGEWSGKIVYPIPDYGWCFFLTRRFIKLKRNARN